MLRALQDAWGDGTPQQRKDRLKVSIQTMRRLRTPAVALMQKALPSGNGNYGPDFRLLS
jgi:hypothetical protein